MAARPLIALTRGDPSGVGPELTLKAWNALAGDPQAPAFLVATQADFLAALAAKLGLDVPLARLGAPQEAREVFPHALPVLDPGGRVAGPPGAPDPSDAAATIGSIEACVGLVRGGFADALTTNPISKEVLYRAGFAHPGHTEFLAALAGDPPPRPVMLLWSPELAVVPATIHIPLKEAPRALTFELLVETGEIVARDFRDRFGIAAPRLAFSGLNPHAGEGGALGREEIEVVAPAVAALRARGIAASGPHPADTMFHERARRAYDVAICMYHDQALIPIKTLAFDHGVNVTLGLPFARTSPDHGTAFDIAGRGIADPSSLVAALRLAGRLA
ncbi:4-hydroxythreonine-4-phosphate dehydrogenase PdxA [Methylocella sp.]|uniref:4-hydroxythreonine-4-phosphate dehydrogenase PdxA n=1 Tax=Methylocella sp. TaxID=1978226 RepID=UPI0035B17643